jgi:hypothetical protein
MLMDRPTKATSPANAVREYERTQAMQKTYDIVMKDGTKFTIACDYMRMKEGRIEFRLRQADGAYDLTVLEVNVDAWASYHLTNSPPPWLRS